MDDMARTLKSTTAEQEAMSCDVPPLIRLVQARPLKGGKGNLPRVGSSAPNTHNVCYLGLVVRGYEFAFTKLGWRALVSPSVPTHMRLRCWKRLEFPAGIVHAMSCV